MAGLGGDDSAGIEVAFGCVVFLLTFKWIISVLQVKRPWPSSDASDAPPRSQGQDLYL